MQQSSVISFSPSFNSYTSDGLAEIAAKVSDESKLSVCDDSKTEEPLRGQSSNDQPQEEDDEDDFEFACVGRNADGTPISADDIFFNGQIRPIYPIFNRDLLFAGCHDDEDSKPQNSSSIRVPLRKLTIDDGEPPSSSSSEADELEEVPGETYCIWMPKAVPASPDRCKKSNSTGSSSRRWRFRDLLHRSNSDGKEAFVFLAPSNTCSRTKKRDEKTEKKVEKADVPKERKNSSEVKVAGKAKAKTAHEIHYMKNRAQKEGDRRRSYLPYRQDLVGFFGNVNGLSKNLHPF